ncbi:MAG: hypothetical protein AAFU70_03130, partial [Planctomycetota bacterium]
MRGFLAILMASALVACERSAPETAAVASEQVIETGGVRVELTLDRDALSPVDLATVRLRWSRPLDPLDVAARRGEPSQDDVFTDAGWTVVERTEAPAIAVDGLVTREVAWRLEPFLPGEYEIPALELRFDEGEEPLVVTETIPVVVADLLEAEAGADDPRLGAFRAAPEPAGAPDRTGLFVGLGAAGVAVTLVLVIAVTRKPRRRTASAAELRAEIERYAEGEASPEALERAESALRALVGVRTDHEGSSIAAGDARRLLSGSAGGDAVDRVGAALERL